MQLQLLSYIALGVFAVVITAKAFKYMKMPLHLRWELYPVPHEKGKEYGGSFFEKLNWWEKPIEKSFFGPIKFLMIEVLFVKSLFHDNRKLWYVSYPFHLGLYLFISSLGLMVLGALLGIAGVLSQGFVALTIKYLAMLTGITGFAVGSIGCVGLFIRRIVDADLRAYSAPKDYFNLLLILSIFVSGLVAYSAGESTYSAYLGYFTSLITFSKVNVSNSALFAHLVLLCAFGLYLPFTHMTHFLGKYFMWDKIRWDDEVNLRGSKFEPIIGELVNQKMDWSAPHIQAGKTWLENVTAEVKKDEN